MGGTDVLPTRDASSLLIQHRKLLQLVADLELTFSTGGVSESLGLSPQELSHQHIATLLQTLIAELDVHFKIEGDTFSQDFSDNPRVMLLLRELDGEHPVLLKQFRAVLEDWTRGASLQEVAPSLQKAVAMFRDHEAREDALFGHE